MSKELIDVTLNRAGWGDSHSLDLDGRKIEAARDPETLPNLLRVTANEPLATILSWPARSGCALQCQYGLSPVGSDNRRETLMVAEAVKYSCRGETFEIELVDGWRGKPHYWGNRSVHEEEVEAAIHGMAPNGELQLLSVRAERDTYDTPRARILQSKDDTAVLFIAIQPEEAKILSGSLSGCAIPPCWCNKQVGSIRWTARRWPAQSTSGLTRRHCQVDEKVVDRPPIYWAPARREPAMLGIRNGRQPQLDNTRRGQHLNLTLRRVSRRAALHLFIDSTDLSMVGEGEWAAAKHGRRGRRGWKKLHLGVDHAGVIVLRR